MFPQSGESCELQFLFIRFEFAAKFSPRLLTESSLVGRDLEWRNSCGPTSIAQGAAAETRPSSLSARP